MEFLDEFESKPRFLLQSKHSPQSDLDPSSSPSPSSFFTSLHKPTLIISLSFSIFFFTLALTHVDFEPHKSILLWLSLSFLIGPLAPPRLTAGDIRVGLGPPLNDLPIETNTEKSSRKSRKTPQYSDGYSNGSFVENRPDYDRSELIKTEADVDEGEEEKVKVNEWSEMDEEKVKVNEWSEMDEELLRKLMARYPAGMPGRWEAIAEGFKGKHKVEIVIIRAKKLGEKRASDRDSYDKFLKARKPVDRRVLDENESNGDENGVVLGRDGSEWSSVEDLALLNALKAFPKEVAMRWEKIAASLPGKTKAACVKRVGELKKDFRSSKGS